MTPSVASDATQPDLRNTKEISYTTTSAFIKLLKSEASPHANILRAVTGCPLDKWLEIEGSLDGMKFRCAVRKFYSARTQFGIFKLMYPVYHGIVRLFPWVFYKLLDRGGYSPGNPIPMGASLFVSEEGSRKEAAATWRPATRTGLSNWPGLVLEVGYPEDLARLRRDARWWLESSPTIKLPGGSHKASVQQVIIIKVKRWEQTLTMESWVLSTTRHTGNRVAKREHGTTILKTPLGKNPTTEISGPATLSIRWDSLFDRTPGLGEGDFVVGTADLKAMANTMWEKDKD